MPNVTKRRVLQEIIKRKQDQKSLDRSELHPSQRAFVDDPSPRVAAVCSRRAGKTYGLGFKVAEVGLKHPGCRIPYFITTKESAKGSIWPALRKISKDFDIPMRFNRSNSSVRFFNGTEVVVVGTSHEEEAEKLRGGAWPLAIIDEAQGIGPVMKIIVRDVIEPGFLDYKGEGQLLVTGTPNAACAGMFYDLTHHKGEMKGFSVHHWTLRENPHLGNTEKWLKQQLEQSGWTEDNATFRREYCGEWVKDVDGQVYNLNTALNVIYSLPPDMEDYNYCLGIDLGYRDPTAFCVAAYSEETGKVIIVESQKRENMLPSDVCVVAEQYCQQYDISSIVADPGGGMSRALIEELRTKYGLPAKPASKSKKADHIAILNGEMSAGIIQIYHATNSELLEEMRLLQWDERSMIIGKLKEDKRTPNHLCDSFLYSWRDCRHQSEDWEENPAVYGSPQYYEALEEEIFRSSVTEYVGDPDKPWWENLV